jgi:hypothetical protein
MGLPASANTCCGSRFHSMFSSCTLGWAITPQVNCFPKSPASACASTQPPLFQSKECAHINYKPASMSRENSPTMKGSRREANTHFTISTHTLPAEAHHRDLLCALLVHVRQCKAQLRVQVACNHVQIQLSSPQYTTVYRFSADLSSRTGS